MPCANRPGSSGRNSHGRSGFRQAPELRIRIRPNRGKHEDAIVFLQNFALPQKVLAEKIAPRSFRTPQTAIPE